LEEDFSSNPSTRWSASGDTTLFTWDSASQNLAVTWDSSRPNSYYHLPLGTVLADADDFSLSFDLRLTSAIAGIDPQKPNPFQLAIGFINLAQATAPGFVRGSGYESPNLVELDFFPDPGGAWMWGPSLTATMIDWTGTNWSIGFAPLNLSTNDLFRITLAFTAADRRLRTSITRNGAPYGPMEEATLGSAFLGFSVDRVAICSYSEAGQDPLYAGSLLAQGSVDNLVVTTPSPIKNFHGQYAGGVWTGKCQTRTNYLYSLERTTDFVSWASIPGSVAGTGGEIVLEDAIAPVEKAFYRVQAAAQP
jgi:hypothetical protein